ncbi:MAG TPA: type II toxin-antitoxin system VapC family toxin [Gemmatimonadaceae bacterium]|nr:type II toxin-antitoxin system VapC family toxin [Gemmatimonadaceae bacterium]
MIFIDSNIPMYLVGAPHPNKDAARRVLESWIEREERLVTDAEVLQEILHRYAAIRRADAIQPAFNALLGVVDEVYAVEREDVLRAKDVMLGLSGECSARDALHIAVMERNDISRIMTFDPGFDRFGWVERLGG